MSITQSKADAVAPVNCSSGDSPDPASRKGREPLDDQAGEMVSDGKLQRAVQYEAASDGADQTDPRT